MYTLPLKHLLHATVRQACLGTTVDPGRCWLRWNIGLTQYSTSYVLLKTEYTSKIRMYNKKPSFSNPIQKQSTPPTHSHSHSPLTLRKVPPSPLKSSQNHISLFHGGSVAIPKALLPTPKYPHYSF